MHQTQGNDQDDDEFFDNDEDDKQTSGGQISAVQLVQLLSASPTEAVAGKFNYINNSNDDNDSVGLDDKTKNGS